VRKYADIYNVPERAIIIDTKIQIDTFQYEEVNVNQIKQTRARYDVERIEIALLWTADKKIPFSKALVFNKG
jgi:hypothetical protein